MNDEESFVCGECSEVFDCPPVFLSGGIRNDTPYCMECVHRIASRIIKWSNGEDIDSPEASS